MSDKESQILSLIKENPFISQKDLANKLGITRSAVAGYISKLMKDGKILGRAYVLPKEKHIVCIGGANIDRKMESLSSIQFHTSNPVHSSQSCGGVARNVAENLGRLGCSTSLITVVGKDSEGSWLLDETRKHHVDISQSITLPEQRSGNYTAVLDQNGEMVIALADMEIYDALTWEMIMERWSHIASSQIIFLDANLPMNVLSNMIRRCKEEGLFLCVDPVSITKAKKLPDELDGVNIIFPNKDEAEIMSGISIESIYDCKLASEMIRKRGVEQVILTLGSNGIYIEADGISEHVAVPKITPVDVTGAGDALVAGVIFGIVQGESLISASRLGITAASLTLQTKNTVSNLNSGILYSYLNQ
ncbi:winged helix-turn-helix transcriptional regulator [Microaerobacter geothermalis]|uniref:carbohydrate kinase n=1 Tax=Microaerobacter geothermalis TaxID=674972 RepID=UPI001F25B084|nr:carbohydrate kinase [Microaerobacter geothermalis]MCF6093093.1 winged helix-turn-helix transcriptional regulator [Microaerobacter geothermalis]